MERSRRVRPQISDDPSDDSHDSSHEQDDESDEGDYDPRKVDAMRRSGRQEATTAPSVSPRSRARTSGRSSAAIHKSYADQKQSLKLTVKAPPSKLREVMRANEVESLQDTLGGGQVIEGSRRRRGQQPPRVSHRAADRPRYQEFGESDIEDEDDADADEDMDDPAGEDDDEDVGMDDPPVPPKAPKITLKPPGKGDEPPSTGKNGRTTKVIVEAPKVGRVLPVEDQEMKDDPDDDEVEDTSDLSDDDDEEGEDDEQEEADEEGDETNLNEEEDAPGEEDEVEVEAGEGGENEELDEEEDDDSSSEDSESETPGSGAATPDPAKMTKRQRRALDGEGFMALEMGPQQRKFFTDEEKAMKKDEHARKRKELTKRKIQEEKTAALNRLLKPQVSKARGAAPKPETLLALERAGEAAVEYEEEIERANPLYTRWISTKDGVKLGVPEEWLGKQAGRMFGPPLPPSNGALVQELD